MMRFRRRSDTFVSAALWWFAFVAAVIGLVVYATVLVTRVTARDAFIQSTNIYFTEFTANIPVPDIIICSSDATLSIPDTAVALKISLNSWAASTVCGISDTFDAMHIVMTNGSVNEKITVLTLDEMGPFYKGHPVQGAIIPAESNLYRPPKYRPDTFRQPEMEAFRSITETNLFSMTQGDNYTVAMTTIPEKTRVLRRDTLGLFGIYNDSATTYTLTSRVLPLVPHFYDGTTFVMLWPSMRKDSREVLVISITDALASWGGAFSLIAGVFYFLFGSLRLSPFGFIQRQFMSKGTKKKISKVYRGQKQDSRYTDEVTQFSQGGMGGQESRGERVWRASCSGTDCHNDHGHVNTGTNFDPSVDIALLRQQVRQLLNCFRMHEKRFNETETLLGEFYLDMDLVDMYSDSQSSPKERTEAGALSPSSRQGGEGIPEETQRLRVDDEFDFPDSTVFGQQWEQQEGGPASSGEGLNQPVPMYHLE